MRHLRHMRHRRHVRYERHGDALQSAINGPLHVGINPSVSIAAGATLTIDSDPSGGFAPYTYVWKKGGVVVAGQNAKTFSKANSVAGDSGNYTCEITDAKGSKAVSSACTVTVTA